MSHTNKTDRLTISKVLHIVKVHLSRPSVRLNKVIFSTAQVDFAVLGKKTMETNTMKKAILHQLINH